MPTGYTGSSAKPEQALVIGRLPAANLLAALASLLPGPARAADPVPPLVLERTIPLAGVSGRTDYMAVDLGRGRLFVAELGNHRLGHGAAPALIIEREHSDRNGVSTPHP